jgi:hypothetical protein
MPPSCYETKWVSESERHPVLAMRLCGRWFDVKLKSGPHFRPQHKDLEDIGSGKAIPCEASIYQKGDSIMAKIVVQAPRVTAATTKERSILVATDSKSLLIGSMGGNEIWRFNADQVPRWVSEHARRLGRLREDAKAFRMAGAASDPAKVREEFVRKQHNRLDSITHQASAMAVNRAIRMRAGTLDYDDSERGFVEHFPWHEMKTKLEQKCAAHGLQFRHIASAGDPEGASSGARVLKTI